MNIEASKSNLQRPTPDRNFKTSDLIFPVILEVPEEKKALSGKDAVAFLRQYARQAVRLSGAKFGMDMQQLHNDASGAPLAANGIFWSLSHKPFYVAGVAASRPVGIDVECLRPVSTALFDKIFDHREQESAGPLTDFLFFRCWTAKEAVLKALGIGLKGLYRCKIERISGPEDMTVSYDGQSFEIKQAHYDNHIISVATQDQHVSWALPEQDMS